MQLCWHTHAQIISKDYTPMQSLHLLMLLATLAVIHSNQPKHIPCKGFHRFSKPSCLSCCRYAAGGHSDEDSATTSSFA